MALTHAVKSVSLQFLRDLATPRALTAAMLIKYGEWDQLATLAIDPRHYDACDGDKFGRDAAATHLLRKCVDLPTSSDRAAAAWNARASAQDSCYRTNLRFRDYRHEYFGDEASLRLRPYLRRVGKIVRDILGPVPNRLWGKFSPGVVLGKRTGLRSYCLGDKVQDPIHVSQSAHTVFLHTWEGTAWERSRRSSWSFVVHKRAAEKWASVPKDALKERGIGIQPLGDVYTQLGVGRYLRARLRRVGIVLEEAQAKHRDIVVQASRSGDISTIDLSSASDTIATEVVRYLVGEEWFALLSSLRSVVTVKDGRSYLNESFSSMGNGFTFELETLLFYAIAKAICGDGEVRVYGDDIIIPSQHDATVRCALRWFGFTVNDRKSYATGYFRESCGEDAFNGTPVRAAYMEQQPCEPHEWISLHNKLKKVLDRHGLTPSKTLGLISNQIPLVARNLGPSGLGDLVLHCEDSARWTSRTRNSIRWVRVWRPVQRVVSLDHFTPDAQLAMALLGVPSRGVGYRGNVTGYRTGRMPWS